MYYNVCVGTCVCRYGNLCVRRICIVIFVYVCVCVRARVRVYLAMCVHALGYIYMQTSLALANTVKQRNRLKNQIQNYLEREKKKMRKTKKTEL